MQLSVVIPLYNEEESLTELHDMLVSVMKSRGYSYEILFIDDGSTDNSWNKITEIVARDTNVRGFRFSKNFGKSQALHLGFKEACGEVVMTMDADLQDDPEEIPEFIELIAQQNYDLVSGWKRKRYDSFFAKNLPSKLFNWAARKTSGLKLHDFNCGIKAYKNEVVKNVDVFGEMHRYIPVLAKNAGYKNIAEKVVRHQSRKYGQTKFGMERFITGFLDLVTIWFLSKFGKRPMHFFGALGVFMFLFGFIAAAYIGGMKVYKLFYLHEPARLVADDPWFYIALTSMILGVQFFLAGFIGEIILRNGKQTERYRVAEKI